MVKKLLLFTPIFLLLLPTNTYAQTYNLTFNTFADTAENLSSNIQCNNNQCIVYNVPFYNYRMDFEWGTTSSPTCSSTAVVSGILYLDNTSFGINNNDFNWSRVYIVPAGSGQSYNCSFSVSENGTSYVCTAPTLSSNFKIGYTLDNNFGGQTSFTSVVVRNVDINCDTSTGQIIENNNQNTQNIINNNTQNSQNIINNQNSNTNSIINNQDNNTQDIIDNQNANNQQQIESQKVCDYIDKSDISIDKSYLAYDGTVNSSNNYGITNYINIENATIEQLTLQSSSNAFLCFYYEDKTLINCISSLNHGIGDYVIPNNAKYIRASIIKSENKPTYNICKNGNQALSDDLNNLNDSITSELLPNTSTSLNDMNNTVASDTPISDLVTMPLTLMNAYINGISASCTNYNLGNLLGTNLVLPCINISSLIGSELWSIIDVLVSIFLIFNISKLFIGAFDSLTSLKDNFGDLYYHGKHEGGDS